ncbi:hypothetical protein CF319_g9280 [Tilletia indica]|nr:hypothetical protein CF319_g9280 [Tilletia indica]
MTLRHVLLELNFEQSVADPAVFIYKAGSKLIVLAVYVDDVLIFSKDLPAIESLKSGLAKRFKMSDQGEVGHFLGMQIERNPDGKGFTISQSTYIRSMLDRFEVSDIKGSRTPLDSKQRLVPYDGIASEEEKKRYQAEIGCLNWIGLGTRSDLVFGIGLLARFSSNPGPVHFGCVKRIMRYLAGTLDFKLRLDARSQTDIEAYSDSDYSGDKSAKSTSGWCIMVFGSTVAWGSKLQPLIADSTAAAEILALWQTSREVIAIRHFFEDIGLRQIGSGAPTTIWCDNTAAGQVVNNPVGNGITRHMERKYLKTREYIEHGLLSVKYIPTRENPADMMTKALPPIIHYEHRTSIGLGLGSTSRVGVLE